jgi:hypothetical protein
MKIFAIVVLLLATSAAPAAALEFSASANESIRLRIGRNGRRWQQPYGYRNFGGYPPGYGAYNRGFYGYDRPNYYGIGQPYYGQPYYAQPVAPTEIISNRYEYETPIYNAPPAYAPRYRVRITDFYLD